MTDLSNEDLIARLREEEPPVRYADFVSDEPIGIIRANECEHDEPSLCTQRFRRLWNEIVDLRAALLSLAADRLAGDGWLPIEGARDA